MSRRFVIAAATAAALLAPSADARAQTRTVVVPGDATVVVPPRGSALPRPALLKPVARQQHRPRLPPMAPAAGEGGRSLGGAGAVAGVLVPAIAAAAVAAVLSNGSGGPAATTSGPARTR